MDRISVLSNTASNVLRRGWFLYTPVVLILALVGCNAAPSEPTQAPPTETPRIVQVVVIATVAPSSTPTLTLTPTETSTVRVTATRTRTPTRPPTARPSNTAIPSPTPIPGPAQICADLIAQKRNELYILYMEATPDLVWDSNPHYFSVGICNSILPPAVPQGRYRAAIYFPKSAHGRAESVPVPATLNPGLNQVKVGPWIPGLENHNAQCNDRPTGDVVIEYDGSGMYQPLAWLDGKTKFNLPIKCGGNYP